jgi:hypothetical protein
MDNLYSLNEILSISDEVIHESNKLCQIIRDKVNQEMKNMNIERYAADDGYGKYIIIHFKHNFFNLKFKIDIKNYISINENYLYTLKGNTRIGIRQMTLKIKIGNPKYFEDIVTHEILHIFQYNKNQKKYENDSLYKILNKIRKNIENYNDTDILFAQALYISYDFEQDAMVHGLFKELEQYDNYIIQFKLRETDEYMFLVDLRHAIKNIDQFDESLFENKLLKSAFLNRLQAAEQRYSTKINHIVQHIFDIRENFDGLVPHYPYISPKRIRAIFEKYEMHDNSENHLNEVKDILKINF